MHFRILKTILVYFAVAASFELANMLASRWLGNGVFEVSGVWFYAVWLGWFVAFSALMPPVVIFYVKREALLRTRGQRAVFAVAAGLHVAFLVLMTTSVASRQPHLFYGATLMPQAAVEAAVAKKERAYYENWIAENERVACSMMVHYLLEEDYPSIPQVDFDVHVFGVTFPMRHSFDRFVAARNADICIPYVMSRGEEDLSAGRLNRALYIFEAASVIRSSKERSDAVMARVFNAKRLIREKQEAELAKRLGISR